MFSYVSFAQYRSSIWADTAAKYCWTHRMDVGVASVRLSSAYGFLEKQGPNVECTWSSPFVLSAAVIILYTYFVEQGSRAAS